MTGGMVHGKSGDVVMSDQKPVRVGGPDNFLGHVVPADLSAAIDARIDARLREIQDEARKLGGDVTSYVLGNVLSRAPREPAQEVRDKDAAAWQASVPIPDMTPASVPASAERRDGHPTWEAYEQAERRGFAMGVEAAAGLCDQRAAMHEPHGDRSRDMATGCRDCAAAIRALAAQSDKREG